MPLRKKAEASCFEGDCEISNIISDRQTSYSVSDGDILRLLELRHHDPFQILGQHRLADKVWCVRALLPDAVSASVGGGRVTASSISESSSRNAPMQRLADTDIFEWRGDQSLGDRYYIEWQNSDGVMHRHIDPYMFPPQLSDLDLYLFGKGANWYVYQKLGAHSHTVGAISGTLFGLWAPDAVGVSVVGDFNRWRGRAHLMRCRADSGVWELFIPGVDDGSCYKFEIRHRGSGQIVVKADPYGQYFERRPDSASIIHAETEFSWTDHDWLQDRRQWDWQHEPVSIYELHTGSWRRHADGSFFTYRELAGTLVPYLEEMHFTHVELLPVAEHPLDQSWGYQSTGYYAPTSRHGCPEDFRFFVDCCHRHGIGVLIDWVAGHFPKDAHGLAAFDGSPLYEHADPRQGEHHEWGTLIFNYGRHEVKNFLLANALFWLREFHVDGLRVDAVAAMLYLDYSRAESAWLPNEYGGNENLEAIGFLRELNQIVHREFPGAVVIAEESTAWPQVSRPTWTGGLGFSMKWNMGWMNDILDYFSKDPVHRRFHHQQLTFAMLYAYHENFVLALSHDEVVHGKKSLLEKMPGDDWQKFANLRLLYTYMFTWPGKKLLFMGCEFAQRVEWRCDQALDWHLLEAPSHKGVQKLLSDLNQLYRRSAPLHRYEFEQRGFAWVDCHDTEQSVLSYLRRTDDDFVVVALNFTPVPRYNYRLGVPEGGDYREVFNSDSAWYGGGNIGNCGVVCAEPMPWMGMPYSVNITLPPLAGVLLKPGV